MIFILIETELGIDGRPDYGERGEHIKGAYLTLEAAQADAYVWNSRYTNYAEVYAVPPTGGKPSPVCYWGAVPPKEERDYMGRPIAYQWVYYPGGEQYLEGAI